MKKRKEEFCNVGKVGVEQDDYDPMKFLDKEKEIMDSKKHEKLMFEQTKNESSYASQFQELQFDNPGDATSANDIPKNINMMKRVDMERNLSLADGWSPYMSKKNMTYNVIPAEHFVHNNMVPSYSGKYGYGDYDKRNNDVRFKS